MGRLGHGSWRWSHGSARAVLYRLGHHGPVSADPGPISEFIGVYDADGGLVGEASYLVGKILGRRHCSLCDITHSPVRRRPEWDDFVRGLGIPFVVLHANEVPADVAAAVAESAASLPGTRAGSPQAPPHSGSSRALPIVLARTPDGLVPILSAEDLAACSGSVARFAEELRNRSGGRVPR